MNKLAGTKSVTKLLLLLILTLLSCSKEDDYPIFYTNDDGRIVVAENSLRELIAVCQESSENYVWNQETLILTVGEIDEEIEMFGDPPDMQYILEFEKIPEGLKLTNATMITGEHHVPEVMGCSDIAPEEHLVMRLSAAVNLDWFL